MNTVMLSQNTYRCRLCLKVSTDVINIFREDFPKMIKILTTIQVAQTDDLPKIACVSCVKRVKSAMVMRKQIIRSHRTLMEEALAKRRHGNVSNTTNIGVISKNSSQNCVDNKSQTNNKDAEVIAPEFILLKVVNELEIEQEESISPIHRLHESSVIDKDKQTASKLNEKNIKNMSSSLDKSEISIVRVNKPKCEKPETNTKATSLIRNSKPRPTNVTSNALINPYIQAPPRRIPKIIFKSSMSIDPSKRCGPKPKPRSSKYDPFLPIPCKVCQKVVQRTNMKKHLEIHDKKTVTCHLCGKVTDHTSLRSHIFYFHKCKEDQYVCDQCGRHFRYKTKFNLHMKKEHGGTKDFECTICGRKFFERKYLNKHIDCHHKKIRPFICDYCGKNFSSKHALKVHLRQHTKTAPYECDTCGLKFKQNVSLKTHRKQAHAICEEETVICEVCGKGFASKVALKSHSRLHERKKCPHCSEIFVRDDYLERHVKEKHGTTELNSEDDESEAVKAEFEDILDITDDILA